MEVRSDMAGSDDGADVVAVEEEDDEDDEKDGDGDDDEQGDGASAIDLDAAPPLRRWGRAPRPATPACRRRAGGRRVELAEAAAPPQSSLAVSCHRSPGDCQASERLGQTRARGCCRARSVYGAIPGASSWCRLLGMGDFKLAEERVAARPAPSRRSPTAAAVAPCTSASPRCATATTVIAACTFTLVKPLKLACSRVAGSRRRGPWIILFAVPFLEGQGVAKRRARAVPLLRA